MATKPTPSEKVCSQLSR